ncbi:murein DD-endopeptidase MepM [bacterium BMS3Abin03]|nr:murein DD-endopeptidase MepM [bacterium BMS3Abin03]
MSLFNSIRNIKKISILFIPDNTATEARSVKISLRNLILWIFLYTILCGIIWFYALSLTGLNNYLLPTNTGFRKEDKQRVEELNQKILFLAKELQSLKVSNERLKYALILGDSTIFDSLNNNVPDSENSGKDIPVGGNIHKVISGLLFGDEIQAEKLLFIKPVSGYVTQQFNPNKGHIGMDFAVKEGMPVYAAAGGYIVFSGFTVEDGFMIIISHANGYITVYKHCSSLIKKQRERVLQGELIALSGNSGTHSTGPHLHFEIWKDGYPVNPESLIINY